MSDSDEPTTTRIKLYHKPADWQDGLEFNAKHVLVRTLDDRGPAIELQTTGAVAGVIELHDLTKPFGGCRSKGQKRYEPGVEYPPENPTPELGSTLQGFVDETSNTIVEKLASSARFSAAQAAVDHGANPLDFEGSDWSDLMDD